MRSADLVLFGLLGLLLGGCRPPATLHATPSPPASTPRKAAAESTRPAVEVSVALIGPEDPEDPRVVFEWIDTHVREASDEPVVQQLGDELRVLITLDGNTPNLECEVSPG